MLITDATRLQNYTATKRVWQGIPGIVRTKMGRTFVSFYSGKTEETFGNYAVLIMSDDGKRFSEPVAVALKEGAYRCFDSVLWIDSLNRLWFVWNVMPGEEVRAVVCEDPDAEFLSWSGEIYIGRGVMMNKPIVLSSGAWLFPIALWRFDIYSEMRGSALLPEDVSGTYVYKTCDEGKTFEKLGYVDVPEKSFDEHMVTELNDGRLMMLVRTKYGIAVSYSCD